MQRFVKLIFKLNRSVDIWRFIEELKHEHTDSVVNACRTDIGIKEDSEFYETDCGIVENTLHTKCSLHLKVNRGYHV